MTQWPILKLKKLLINATSEFTHHNVYNLNNCC